MTSVEKNDANISAIIDRFKKSAVHYHLGRYADLHDVANAGIDGTRDAVRELDALGPEGREFLVPLLEDPNPDVRVMVSPFLYKAMPERVVAVLKEVHENYISEASMTASHYLMMHKWNDFGW